jgi:hypothetical protein
MAKSFSVKVGDFVEVTATEKDRKKLAFLTGEVVEVSKGFSMDDGNLLTVNIEGEKLLMFESMVKILQSMES